MTHSVEQTHAEKMNSSAKQKIEKNETTYTPDNSSNRREFNRKARELAWISGQKKFLVNVKNMVSNISIFANKAKINFVAFANVEFTRNQNQKRKEQKVTP